MILVDCSCFFEAPAAPVALEMMLDVLFLAFLSFALIVEALHIA